MRRKVNQEVIQSRIICPVQKKKSKSGHNSKVRREGARVSKDGMSISRLQRT